MMRASLHFIKITTTAFLFYALFFSAICFSHPSKDLKLEDVLTSVNSYYPQIKIAFLKINQAEGDYITALGRFDPSLNASTRSQPFGGYVNHYGDTELNIPTLYNGLTFFTGYRNGRGDWPIYYQNYLSNSGGEYRAGLSFPLLRDRLIDKERTGLFTQAETVCIKKYDAEVTKINIYQETVKAYWQWVESGLQLQIYNELLDLARVRQKAIEKRAHEGDLAKLDIAENMQLILQREQFCNQGKIALRQAAIQLSLYYRNKEGKPEIPLESQLPKLLPSRSLNQAKIFAQLEKHPAMKQLQAYTKIAKLKLGLAQNEMLPNLDVTVSTFKQYGSGGDPLLIPQAAMMGLTLKFPLYQREAKGKLISAQNELQEIHTEIKFLYERLKNELSKLFLGIKLYHQQVFLLEKELNLAHQLQAAETKKFNAGDSSLFLVNQREQAAAQVELNWNNARIKLLEMSDLSRFFSNTLIHNDR
ncbi:MULTISPECIES: TolC family protein [unclassified Legionella]|uniref:TolC family protein n=1 Tax=unclassified Legionella TaxID=2622702 RepID=UPI001F5EB772|nr:MULTISPECIES: TolC family protein [unclassified Legionella]MDI9819819.1 TolC family protein [Legionella sp. PL877]